LRLDKGLSKLETGTLFGTSLYNKNILHMLPIQGATTSKLSSSISSGLEESALRSDDLSKSLNKAIQSSDNSHVRKSAGSSQTPINPDFNADAIKDLSPKEIVELSRKYPDYREEYWREIERRCRKIVDDIIMEKCGKRTTYVEWQEYKSNSESVDNSSRLISGILAWEAGSCVCIEDSPQNESRCFNSFAVKQKRRFTSLEMEAVREKFDLILICREEIRARRESPRDALNKPFASTWQKFDDSRIFGAWSSLDRSNKIREFFIENSLIKFCQGEFTSDDIFSTFFEICTHPGFGETYGKGEWAKCELDRFFDNFKFASKCHEDAYFLGLQRRETIRFLMGENVSSISKIAKDPAIIIKLQELEDKYPASKRNVDEALMRYTAGRMALSPYKGLYGAYENNLNSRDAVALLIAKNMGETFQLHSKQESQEVSDTCKADCFALERLFASGVQSTRTGDEEFALNFKKMPLTRSGVREFTKTLGSMYRVDIEKAFCAYGGADPDEKTQASRAEVALAIQGCCERAMNDAAIERDNTRTNLAPSRSRVSRL